MGQGIRIGLEKILRKSQEIAAREIGMDMMFDSLGNSVVCIRNHGLLRTTGAPIFDLHFDKEVWNDWENRNEKSFAEILEPDVSYGTGVVIGTDCVEGNNEYLILTNNHVLIPDYFKRFRARRENGAMAVFDSIVENRFLNIVENSNDYRINPQPLEIVARAPDSDAAILRTVGAKGQFEVFPFGIGLNGDKIKPGLPIITAGFPGGDKKIITDGKLISIEEIDISLTPYPNLHYLGDIRIDPGQSGSPVVAPVIKHLDSKVELDFRLIGLIYGGSKFAETIRMITPATGFISMLETHESIPSKRPLLGNAIDEGELLGLMQNFPQMASRFDLSTYSLGVSRDPESERLYRLSLHRQSGNFPIQQEYISWLFDFEGGVAPRNLVVVKEGKETVHPLDSELNEKSRRYILGSLNYLKNVATHIRMNGVETTGKDSVHTSYITNVINEFGGILQEQSSVFITDIYRRDLVSRHMLF